MENEEFSRVAPSEHTITIKGKKRRIKFGNYALAQVEKKYGSLKNFNQLQSDMSEKPMATLPWLLSITCLDKDGIDNLTGDELFVIMDEENISIRELMEVIAEAMTDSMSSLGNGGKKKTMKKN